MYIVTSFVFFMVGGLLALLMRAELARPVLLAVSSARLSRFAGMGDQVPAAANNFISLPRIRSERPAFELHHPPMIDRLRTEAHPHRGWQPLQATESSAHLAIGATSKNPGQTPT